MYDTFEQQMVEHFYTGGSDISWVQGRHFLVQGRQFLVQERHFLVQERTFLDMEISLSMGYKCLKKHPKIYANEPLKDSYDTVLGGPFLII